MRKRTYLFLLLILILFEQFIFAQQNKIDSLHNLLKTINVSLKSTAAINGGSTKLELDTTRINTLNALAWELRSNNPDSAIMLSTEALYSSTTVFGTVDIHSPLEKIKEKYIAKSFHQLGVFNFNKDNYPMALEYDFKALKIRESLNDKKGIATTMGNMGIVYSNQGDYSKALNYYFSALKIAEELGDKNGIARHLGNIGLAYSNKGDYPEALNYYFKALKMKEQLGNEDGVAITLGNIGNLFQVQTIKTNTQLHPGRNDSLFKNALNYYFKALQIVEKLEDKNGMTLYIGSIGNIYANTKRYREGEKYLRRALTLCDSIGAMRYKMQFENCISEMYEQTNQPAKALEHYRKYIITKDSLFNEANTKKTVRSEMNFEFDKKQAIEKAEQEKQNAVAQQEKQKQKIILILVSCFLLLVVVFAIFMLNRWRITQKQKITIEKQKEKIVDSITYAQLIQQSILMEESEIQKYLPDSFIYFQPKDIVSGDFYWFSKVEGRMELGERITGNGEQLPAPDSRLPTPNSKLIIAAVDCTGHGVPGAFMSMIGNTLLNQIVNEKQITLPSEILRQLNLGVTEALHQKKESSLSHDGMDIAVCCIDYKNNQIQFAGAQNPLYVLADNEITVINADKQSIGGGGLITRKKAPTTIEYKNHSIPIKKDMSIFLFSDGYMDQFGGNERKKFGIQQFKELLLANQQLSMEEQKKIIVKAHENWKGSTAQIDDILVIGIKIC